MSIYLEAYYLRGRVWILETVLRICFDSKTRNRAEHIRGLEQKNKSLKREIRNMQESAEANNIRAKALNILVACDGPCCSSYMDDPESITQETVNSVERNYQRFMRWWRRGACQQAKRYREKQS